MRRGGASKSSPRGATTYAPRRSLRNQPALLDALRNALAKLNDGLNDGINDGINDDTRGAGDAARRSRTRRGRRYALDVFQGGRRISSSEDYRLSEWRVGRSATAGGGGGTSGGGLGHADGGFAMRLADAAELFSRAALLTGPHGGGFLNLIYCAPGTPIIEIGYTAAQPMPYPSYYHTMARRLGLQFWVVLGSGAYDRPISAPVSEVVALVTALLQRGQRSL